MREHLTPGAPLAVALDTPDLTRLAELAAVLGPHVGLLKVGLEAFIAHGPAAFHATDPHAPVFADLKLHDIPTTVAGAAAAAGEHGVAALTVHASGGAEMVRAAVDAAPGVAILAVTVLTSLDDADLAALGQAPADRQVPELARLAVDAGAAGVVCAPGEVASVRAAVGADPTIVTPGVRPAGAGADDQRRTATPAAAMAAGADLLVVGRPITRAPDPAAAAQELLADLDAAGT